MNVKIVDVICRFCGRVALSIGVPFLVLVFFLMFISPLSFLISIVFNSR